ncbi:MAG: ABC transporter ATP-binding protein [Acholeplasma sp.]|nr:MAG: ABC transporter ATP-binding protein [Acholeplasma sp.]
MEDILMKHKIRYFRYFPIVILFLSLGAYLSFRLSLLLFDVVTIAEVQDWPLFWSKAKEMLIIAAILFPANMLIAWSRSIFIKDAMQRMKVDYLKQVFHKHINEFQKENNAVYVSALTNDFNIIEQDYFMSILEMSEAIIGFITGIIIFIIISPMILFVGLGVMLINGLLSQIVTKPVRKHNEERSILFAGYSGFIKEVLSAFNIIKSNGLEERVKENFYRKSESVQEKKYVIDRILSFVYAAQTANFSIIFLGVMLFVSYMAIQGLITFAGIAVIATNIDRVVEPIGVFSQSIPRWMSVKSIFKRIKESTENKENDIETINLDSFQESIELNDVSFGYDDHQVLSHVNLRLEKGKKYLIIGPSGGGKSTILRLLRKYFKPQTGSIFVDGIALNDVKKESYYAKIANIEQQVFLFEDTVRHNLTLYRDYSDEVIWKAIEQAGLKEFILSHEEGLDFMILDNGKNISGGEKSRIAIARGLISQADILYLDEAFASLDFERVKAIESILIALNHVTVINVSHVVIEEHKALYDQVITVHNKGLSIIDNTWWIK